MCAFKSNGNESFDDNSYNSNNHKVDMKRVTVPKNGTTAPKIEVINFDNIDEHGPSFTEAFEQTEIVTGDEEQYNKIYKTARKTNT